jgi:hypothetical protein
MNSLVGRLRKSAGIALHALYLLKPIALRYQPQWRGNSPDLIAGEHGAEALLAKIQQERENIKPKKPAKKKSTAKKTASKKAVKKTAS